MSDFMTNINKLGINEIGLHDTFHFSCNCCGHCCRNRNDHIENSNIMLSGPDVRRISNYLHISIQEVVEKYLNKYFDKELGLTMCRLKIRTDGSCRFLTKGKCTIHAASPRTCTLYPISRGIEFSVLKNKIAYDHTSYYLCNDGKPYECDTSSSGYEYTVEEWLVRNNIPLEDTEDIQWMEKLLKLSNDKHKDAPDFQINAFKQLYFE